MNAIRMMSVAILLSSGAVLAQAAPAPAPASAPPSPTEVALSESASEGSHYKRFPGGERIYIYDRDPIGQSTCNDGCSGAWPPVIAPDGSRPVGNWTIITRQDGRNQWALKGRPIYVRFHDIPPAQPPGGGWRLLSRVEAELLSTPAPAAAQAAAILPVTPVALQIPAERPRRR